MSILDQSQKYTQCFVIT